MRRLPPRIARELENREDELVERARTLAAGLLGGKESREHGRDDEDGEGSRRMASKEGQLRNIQSMAEESDSWEAVKLFIRYQAARDQLRRDWAEEAVKQLEALQDHARALAPGQDPGLQRRVHMELVARVLGYAVRWHVWDLKKPKSEARP